MPTYEYACSACGNQWEQIQRITEAPIDLCPKCAQSSAYRLISGGTNFILKGGGWYSDLYSSPKAQAKNSDEGAAASSEPAAPTAATTGKAAEGKPAEGKAATAAPASPTKAASPTPPATPPAGSS